MKSFKLETRPSVRKVIILAIISTIIAVLLIRVAILYFDIQEENRLMIFGGVILLSFFPTIFTFLSMIDNSTYLSGLIIEKETIRFIYSQKNKINNVEIIEKQNIEEFNLTVNADILRRRKSVEYTYDVTLKILLKNGEKITILNGNECCRSTLISPKQKLVKALLENKEDIPNLILNVDGRNLQTVNSLKYLYDTGKKLPLQNALYYSLKSRLSSVLAWLMVGIIALLYALQ